MLLSIPIGVAVDMKETYGNMKLLLDCINYKKYQWKLDGDLKVVVVSLGLQQCWTKFCRFLCECASWAKSSHYKKRDWPYLQSLEPEKENVQHRPLEESSKILLSPLNIELGLMQNSVRALDQTGSPFRHLAEKFQGISAAKIKEGVFICP